MRTTCPTHSNRRATHKTDTNKKKHESNEMKTNVGVFFGGRSVEHEISVISALQAIAAMDKDKYTVTPIYISKQGRWYTGPALLQTENYRDMKALCNRCTQVYLRPEYGNNTLYKSRKPLFGSDALCKLDVIIPVLHGTNGEDGIFEGMIEMTGIPYAACNPLSSANGMDKITMKMILRQSGIPVVDYIWFTDRQWGMDKESLATKAEQEIGYPMIVKPANLGSSVGIGQAHDRTQLIEAVNTACQYSTRIIVEHMVCRLKEINCSVLGTADEHRTSVCEEPLRSGEILSYRDKYMGGSKSAKGSKGMQSTQRRIPADLPAEITERIQHYASQTFRVLSCMGVARVDVMIDEDSGDIFVNEINAIPGSLSFYLWEASGLKFPKLMDTLVDLALRRSRHQALKIDSYDQNIFNLGGGAKGGKWGK